LLALAISVSIGAWLPALGEEPTLTTQRTQVPIRGGAMSVAAITVDLKAWKFKILSFSDLQANFPALNQVGWTVDDFRQLTGAKLTIGPIYLSQYQPPVAWGLVKIDDKIRNPVVPRSWVLSALLCLDDGHPVLVKFDDKAIAEHSDCLQTGPMLIVGGKAVDRSALPEAVRYFDSARKRWFVCTVPKPDELIFGSTSAISVSALTDSLLSANGAAGTVCDTAALVPGAAYIGNEVGTDQLFPYMLAIP
jgi:hypothetical protein